MNLVEDVYRLTEEFPISERYGLSQQLRKAAVSIPSNIAEGAARQYRKEFIQFLFISLGSLSEVETQLDLANRLVYFSMTEEVDGKIIRVRQMLCALIRKLKT